MIIFREDETFTDQFNAVELEMRYFARDLFFYANYESVKKFLIEQKFTKLIQKEEDMERRIFSIFDRMFQHYGKTLMFFVLINLFPEKSNCKAVYLCSELYFDRLHSQDANEVKRANYSIRKFFKSFFKFKMDEMSSEFISGAEGYVLIRIINMLVETEIDATPIIEEELDKNTTEETIKTLSKFNDLKAERYYQLVKKEEFAEIKKKPPEEIIKNNEITFNRKQIIENIFKNISAEEKELINKPEVDKIYSTYSIEEDYDKISSNGILNYYESLLHNNSELINEYHDYIITYSQDGYEIINQPFELLGKNVLNFESPENAESIQELMNDEDEFGDDSSDMSSDEPDEIDEEDLKLLEEEEKLYYEECGVKFFADYWYLQKYLEVRALDNAEYDYQAYKCGLIESMALYNSCDLIAKLVDIVQAIASSEGFKGFSQIKPIEIQLRKKKGKQIQQVFNNEETKKSKKNN